MDPELDQGLKGYTLQPDVPIQGEIMFEVPRDAAAGLRFQLSSQLWVRENLNQTVVEVDLGIDQAKVTGWLAVREPLKYADPRVKA